MVVCKYFQAGHCRNGSRCRFEHYNSYDFRGYESSGERSYGTGESILRGSNTPLRSRYGSGDHSQSVLQSTQQQPYQQKTSRFNLQEIMQVIIKDITQAEKGNQWQLSCYTPVKELPNFPGLEDYSPEEMRWDCYKACKDNTIPLWQATIQHFFTNVAKINNELKKKTGYTLIDKWLREAEENIQSFNTSFGTTQGMPGTTSNMSVFGNSNTAIQSVFGGKTVNPSGFGNSSNIPSSPFGSNTSANMNNSFFSQPPVMQQTGSFSFSPQQQVSPQASPQSPQPYTVVQPNVTIDLQEYSKEEELSKQELDAFKAKDFSFGSIPTKPPPKSLCVL